MAEASLPNNPDDLDLGLRLDDCKKACTEQGTDRGVGCAAFDFNRRNGQCFKHGIGTDWEVQQVSNGYDIDQYT